MGVATLGGVFLSDIRSGFTLIWPENGSARGVIYDLIRLPAFPEKYCLFIRRAVTTSRGS